MSARRSSRSRISQVAVCVTAGQQAADRLLEDVAHLRVVEVAQDLGDAEQPHGEHGDIDAVRQELRPERHQRVAGVPARRLPAADGFRVSDAAALQQLGVSLSADELVASCHTTAFHDDGAGIGPMERRLVVGHGQRDEDQAIIGRPPNGPWPRRQPGAKAAVLLQRVRAQQRGDEEQAQRDLHDAT